ncbi:hypothetical protein XA68_16843 [Ophiocordyceps unilateralis]|uniref:Uncharacterized protein n=1 Tax=Ophiocordyceps unilateralis TaxID=268505 RepID=A0A2A9P5U8_OPHUN|nr:hypothetical protein XA68_16843 [Ophiocordyceps unilateralis]
MAMTTTTLHVAATAPINPPGATPVLSQEQVWEGLRRKVRHAEEFVPLIVSCAVVEEEEDKVVTRKVVFADAAEGKAVTEVCTEYAPSRVHFRMDSGTEVQNIISRGVHDGGLFMTYAFAWLVPTGSDDEVRKMREKQQKVRRRYGRIEEHRGHEGHGAGREDQGRMSSCCLYTSALVELATGQIKSTKPSRRLLQAHLGVMKEH